MQDQVLKVENISAGYGSTVVVNSFSFSLRHGEIVLITGRNGVGKTTLLKSIMGVIPVKSGNLILDNDDITKKKFIRKIYSRNKLCATRKRDIFFS